MIYKAPTSIKKSGRMARLLI